MCDKKLFVYKWSTSRRRCNILTTIQNTYQRVNI
jgi:hypothetical protein